MSLRYIQCCSCSVFTVCATCNVISSVKYVLYFYISTSRSLCAVPNMAVFCSSLISRFPGMLPRYCLGDLEMVPVAPITNGITSAFTFHMRRISIIIIIIIIIITIMDVSMLFATIVLPKASVKCQYLDKKREKSINTSFVFDVL